MSVESVQRRVERGPRRRGPFCIAASVSSNVRRHAPITLDNVASDEHVRGMFGLLKKDPKKKLRSDYERLLSEANALQRRGDIQGYATKMAEAEEVGRKLDAM